MLCCGVGHVQQTRVVVLWRLQVLQLLVLIVCPRVVAVSRTCALSCNIPGVQVPPAAAVQALPAPTLTWHTGCTVHVAHWVGVQALASCTGPAAGPTRSRSATPAGGAVHQCCGAAAKAPLESG